MDRSEKGTKIVSPAKGGQVVAGDFHIDFPAATFSGDTSVSTKKVDTTPSFITKEMQALGALADDFVKLGNAYDVETGTASLSKPALIKAKYDRMVPASALPEALLILQQRNGEWFVLPTYFNRSERIIYSQTDHFSYILVISTLLFLGAGMAATMNEMYKRHKNSQDPHFLEPEKVDTSGFDVDAPKARLTLKGKTLKGREDWIVHNPLNPSQWQKQEVLEGTCVDWGFLLGSQFIKEKYHVRMVPGAISDSDGKGGERNVGHLWVEVVIDNRPYYVDVVGIDKKGIRLVPLQEAYKKNRLVLDLLHGKHPSFWKEYIDGEYVVCKSRTHNPNWWKEYVNLQADDIERETFHQMVERAETAKKFWEIQMQEARIKSENLEAFKKSGNSSGSAKEKYEYIQEMEQYINKMGVILEKSGHVIRWIREEKLGGYYRIHKNDPGDMENEYHLQFYNVLEMLESLKELDLRDPSIYNFTHRLFYDDLYSEMFKDVVLFQNS